MILNRKKVLVGMSGGVDSSVAAWLLKEQGYEVVGISMNLLSCSDIPQRSCCSARDRDDARKVCEYLGVKHYTIDLRREFNEQVIKPFIEEYLKGHTPSPCILCNEYIKFHYLLSEAKKIGAQCIATGHYARIVDDSGVVRLFEGADPKKDQTYFLFCLNQGELAKLKLPLGDFTKKDVREIARKNGIPTYEKPESQEVCFVSNDDYVAFLESRAQGRLSGAGNFTDTNGNVLGKHTGIHAYTIGQRRGLKIAVGERKYVTRIDADKNEVVLGKDEDLFTNVMLVSGVSWTCGVAPKKNNFRVKIRSTHSGDMASVKFVDGDKVEVNFETPVRAIAPGQAAVFYDGQEVVGGGWIEK